MRNGFITKILLVDLLIRCSVYKEKHSVTDRGIIKSHNCNAIEVVDGFNILSFLNIESSFNIFAGLLRVLGKE